MAIWLLTPILFLGALITLGMIPGWLAAGRALDRSVELLAQATTPEELDAAAGRLGVVLNRPNGEWVVIRYTDSHQWPGVFSCAVARFSDGRWYQSWNHYCGLFLHMRWVDDPDDFPPDLRLGEINRSRDLSLLEAVRTGHSLNDAEKSLIELGFERFEGPRSTR